MNKIKEFFNMKYSHAISLLYLAIYFPWFFALEDAVTTNYTSIHTWLDDVIPFCEVFIIPYVLWYFFVAGTFIYLFFASKKEFWKYAALLFGGMTICLTIFTIFPNGQDMRPDFEMLGRSNFFLDVVKYLHSIDTCTNVLPSIHVYNSIATCIAISYSEKLKEKKWIQIGSLILTVAICLSTVFLKQHSVLDGIAAIGIILILYPLIYKKKNSNKKAAD